MMLCSLRRHGLTAVLGSVFSCFFVASAGASFTTVNGPATGEKSILQILNHIYDTTFTADGLNYTSSTLSAVRIEDVLGTGNKGSTNPPRSLVDDLYTPPQDGGANPMIQGSGDPSDDQLWTAAAVSATAEARFASFSQEFGYVKGMSGGTYQSLINVQGSGFNVTGSKSISNLSNQVWRWARGGENGTFTSQNSENPDGLDHMVTYEIMPRTAGAATQTKYVLFFEDLKPNQHPDDDFNDLAIEIIATPASGSIPEPACMGALALAGLGSLRRFGRREG